MLRVCLIQLPVPDVTGTIGNTNIPLAAGYLAAYSQKRHQEKVEIHIPPDVLMDEGGDEAILSYLFEHGFDLIGFSLYLWNLERSSFLASRIKAASPEIMTCAGGPETADITSGRQMFFQYFDFIVSGEGEIAFADLVDDVLRGQREKRVYRAEEIVDLSSIPNPYLSGTLSMHAKKPVYLETMRGCPNRCSYCFYGKAYSGLRFFPDAVAEQTISAAKKNMAPEIYLMDPSFNVSPGLDERLKKLAELNESGIPLHTELRLESITDERARLLKAAGFRSVEVGLQSIHAESLKRVHRSLDRNAFEKGANLLTAAGIEVRTGVILGLPGETAEEFLSTVEFVKNLDIGKALEIYPLAVLPGTECRERSNELGLSYMTFPPYWVLATDRRREKGLLGMSEGEFFAVIPLIEETLGIDYFLPILPSLIRHTDFISFVDMRQNEDCEYLMKNPGRIANRLTLLVDLEFIRSQQAERAGKFLAVHNPFTTIRIVIRSHTEPKLEDIDKLIKFFFKPDHYTNRTFYFKQDSQNMFSTRIFLLTENKKIIEGYVEGETRYDLIVDYRPGMLKEMSEAFSSHPLVFLADSISEQEQKTLAEEYMDFRQLILRDR